MKQKIIVIILLAISFKSHNAFCWFDVTPPKSCYGASFSPCKDKAGLCATYQTCYANQNTGGHSISYAVDECIKGDITLVPEGRGTSYKCTHGKAKTPSEALCKTRNCTKHATEYFVRFNNKHECKKIAHCLTYKCNGCYSLNNQKLVSSTIHCKVPEKLLKTNDSVARLNLNEGTLECIYGSGECAQGTYPEEYPCLID